MTGGQGLTTFLFTTSLAMLYSAISLIALTVRIADVVNEQFFGDDGDLPLVGRPS